MIRVHRLTKNDLRIPMMSKWNTSYKRAGEVGCILSKQKQTRKKKS